MKMRCSCGVTCRRRWSVNPRGRTLLLTTGGQCITTPCDHARCEARSSVGAHDLEPCSFVKEFASVKRKAEDAADMDACIGLRHILEALAACVTSLRERKHDALLREVLGINLYRSSQVTPRVLGTGV